jgi:non-ribosomal peptide synthetase component F
VPGDVWRAAAGLAARNRVTPFVVFLAAFAVVLSACGGRREVLVGVPTTGRRSLAAMETIGLFVSTVPFWCRVDPRLRFPELLAVVRGASTGLYRHSGVSLLEIAAVMDRDRQAIGSTPYRITFNFLQTPHHDLSLDRLAVRRLRVVPRALDVDLSVRVEAGGRHPVVEILDGGDGGSAATYLLDCYLYALGRIAAMPTLCVGDLMRGAPVFDDKGVC